MARWWDSDGGALQPGGTEVRTGHDVQWCFIKAQAPARDAPPGSPPSPPGSLVPDISSWQLNPPPSQEVKKCDTSKWTLKFNRGHAYFMRLNKASLQMSQIAPWGGGSLPESHPAPRSQGFLICLPWHPRDHWALPAPARAKCGPGVSKGAAFSSLTSRGCLRSS